MTPTGLSPRSLLEYGGLKPILPVLGGRSDAACRVVIRLHVFHLRRPHGFYNAASLPSHSPFPLMPMWSQMVVGGIRRNGIPANADCRGGVFATRRFPRPIPPHTCFLPSSNGRPSSPLNARCDPLNATWHATSLQRPAAAAVRAYPPATAPFPRLSHQFSP